MKNKLIPKGQGGLLLKLISKFSKTSEELSKLIKELKTQGKIIKYIPESNQIIKSEPYVRLSQEGYLNEAFDIYPKNKRHQFFQVVKDVDNPVKGQLQTTGNGQYSIHFHTTRNGITPLEKEQMFQNLVESIPEDAAVSTWGKVTPGGYHGLNRFGSQFGWTKIGERPGVNGPIPIYKKIH